MQPVYTWTSQNNKDPPLTGEAPLPGFKSVKIVRRRTNGSSGAGLTSFGVPKTASSIVHSVNGCIPCPANDNHFAYHRHQRLYIRVGITTYQVCKPTRNPGEYRFHLCVRLLATIRDVHPMEVVASRFNPDNWSVNPAHHSVIEAPVLSAQAATFEAFVNTLDPWELDVLRTTTMHVDPNALCDALSHGLRAASDGSVRFMTQGAFGWALSTNHG